MESILTKLRTLYALGLGNVCRVGLYRVGLRSGLHPVQKIQAEVSVGPFFRASDREPSTAPALPDWQTEGRLFSHWPIPVGDDPPNWLANSITGQQTSTADLPWWEFSDFDANLGDIKVIWELSRFDWVLAMTQRIRQGNPASLERLNHWLADWCHKNPPFRGPNWKCGQEASFRVMQLAVAAKILGQVDQPEPSLLALIRLHLERIAPSISYAIGQCNNHGTSEAAALFIGGSWLERHGDPTGRPWRELGSRWLADRARRLIGREGTFSQYSVNYHRVVLDTYSLAEIWRREMGLAAFDPTLPERLIAASRWLFNLIEPSTGDAPNIGANDGARLLQLTETNYRDFRPAVSLAMALFESRRAFADHSGAASQLAWLDVPPPQLDSPVPASLLADEGGFAILRNGHSLAVLRYPRYRFRPSQADALHCDLWIDGLNQLRDAGTFSYHANASWTEYFNGTSGHNTIQFDDRDQMPRLSRFLFGNWLRTTWIKPLTEDAEGVHFGAEYRDSWGATHRRCLRLTDESLKVDDQISGFSKTAVLRWRMQPGTWMLEHEPGRIRASLGPYRVEVQATMKIQHCDIVEGWESRHYLERRSIPVLEIHFDAPGSITSTYSKIS